MTIEIAPTLELMSQIYGLSASGGVDSERFTSYRHHAEDRRPIHGYNPMTPEPVVDTVDALIAIDAEAVASEAANDVAEMMQHTEPVAMHLTVATPGAWTDRFGSEVDHRLRMTDPAGVMLWHGEAVTAQHVREQAAAQTVRMILHRQRDGAPRTLREAVDQEGLANRAAGEVGQLDADAASALEVLGDDESLATMVGFLYGDAAAATMGYPGVGLRERVGYDHAVALHDTVDS